jgi:uncharacterized protein
VVFKRRTPRTYLRVVGEFFYPRGGWRRAGIYVAYRLRRLPDPAHRISRGIAAGVFVSFTPFFGLHFFFAALIAWLIRGNILAALLATFAGNPFTFPFIAAVSVEFGAILLNREPISLQRIPRAFSQASIEIWSNLAAFIRLEPTQWGRLSSFFFEIFLPYFVGSLIPGLIAGVLAYWISNPVIASYQRGRIRRLKERLEKRRAAVEEARLERARALGLEPSEADDPSKSD